MHGCRRCVHTTSSQQPVSTGARGYGCGVCARYLSSEDAYIEHVGAHWEAGKTPSDWYYSRVIYGLLRRPGVDEAWNQLLRTKYVDPIRFPVFVWNRLAVGEGTASNAFGASLQEALEMLHEIPGLKAADVAAGAHTMAIRTPREHAMSCQDMFIDRQELQQPSQQPSLGVSSGFATPTMQTQFTGFPHHPQQQTPSSVASLDVTSPNFVISPSTSVYQQDSQHQGQPHGEWIGMVPGYAGTGRLGMGMAPGF
ncbi:hypothetical protein DL546_000804 [Coniochaeta pulveracea]|uniref:C2H2-type domain-containing protein n=1 Tax=Coniochaeta pulveracea TaxID=177199 RepID=A0A420Y276_9PEZI|nr:hypothetical protein DL546_000804 [Coniochaeta pulveracea]